jgi:thiol-disulfide isomerase/thioredoxin
MPVLCMMLLLALGAPAVAEPAGGIAPPVHGDYWINSKPLLPADLAGKVVLVEFWTFACGNCRNVQPYIKQWHERYARDGLLILAVHTPEFPYEANFGNVARYVRDNDIRYVVPVDNDFTTWRRYENAAWPALYLISRDGRIRYTHVGEGAYAETEQAIRRLLAERLSNR